MAQTLGLDASNNLASYGTLTATRRAAGSYTTETASSVTQQAGTCEYLVVFPTNATGNYRVDLLLDGNPIGMWGNYILDGTASTFWPAGYQPSVLDASGVRSAVGLASSNLDTQLGAIDDYIDTEVAAIKAKTDNLPASFPVNFSSLGINASGHVNRVTLVDTTTTNTDMLTAAGVRSAVGLAAANLDTQLDALTSNVSPASQAALNAGTFAVHEGVDFSLGFDIEVPATWSKIYFTAKEKASDDDSSAVLQLLVTNPANASTDGLIRLNKAAGTKSQGSLAVAVGLDSITVALDAVATAALASRAGKSYPYDFKIICSDASVPYVSEPGSMSVKRLVTDAIT